MWNLLIQIIIGIAGLFLAQKFVPGVTFNGPIYLIPGSGVEFGDLTRTLVFAGALIGVLNAIVKPILNTIALPLRIITLNLFSLVIAMAMIWIVDIFSLELAIKGILPLFWTTLIIWGVGLVLKPYAKK